MQFCLTNCNKKSQYDHQQELEDLWCWTALHLCSEHPVVWLTSDRQNKLHLCHFAICCIRFWHINPLENPMSYILLRTFIFQLRSCSGLLARFLESGCFDNTNLLIFHTLYHANDSIFLCISCFLDSIVKADRGMALGFLEKHSLFFCEAKYLLYIIDIVQIWDIRILPKPSTDGMCFVSSAHLRNEPVQVRY